MKRILLAIAMLAILTAAFASPIQANPPKSHVGGSKNSGAFNPATIKHASVPAFNHGALPKVNVSVKSVSVQKFTPSPVKSVSVQKFNPAVIHGTPLVKNTPHVNPIVKTTNGVRFNVQPASKYVNYHVTHGTQFAHGTLYRGRNHFHWGMQRWDARYGCYCYWDPCCRAWYYWNQPMGCYYPVSYCPQGVYAWGPQQPMPQVPMVPVNPNGPIVDPGQPSLPSQGVPNPNDFPPMNGPNPNDFPPMNDSPIDFPLTNDPSQNDAPPMNDSQPTDVPPIPEPMSANDNK